jgi:hypothetical protein
MPDATYIKKKTARNIIVGIFIFFTLALGAGLQLVKIQARDYAVAQAVRVNNHTTCALRALVDPPIAGYKRTLALALKTADDPTVNKQTRERAAASARNTLKTLAGLQNFRAVYNTVPPGYKCPTKH